MLESQAQNLKREQERILGELMNASNHLKSDNKTPIKKGDSLSLQIQPPNYTPTNEKEIRFYEEQAESFYKPQPKGR